MITTAEDGSFKVHEIEGHLHDYMQQVNTFDKTQTEILSISGTDRYTASLSIDEGYVPSTVA